MTIALAPRPKATSRSTRAGWAVFAGFLAIFVVVVLTSMQAGVADDPRIANPNPGPEPYPVSPFLDAVPFLIMSIGQAIVLWAVLLGLSWRAKKLHWAAIIALGAIFTGLVDPIANWATFASLNPSVPHLPTDWAWVRLSPLSEPAAAFLGGYASYYLAIGLTMYWLADRLLVRRAKPGSWVERHPLATIFVSAWVLSFPVNALFQLTWMQLGMFVYTQFAGPVIHVGHLQLPVLILFYDPFVYATVAIMCRRNDYGESAVIARLASKLPVRSGRPRNSAARQVLVAGVLMITSILGPIAFFAVLRATGVANTITYDEYPFPETKVYDPYGDLQEAGKPGPFFG